MTENDAADGAASGERRRWWIVFGLLMVCFTAWATTMPLFSAPDEPAHVIRAVGLSHGAVLPDEATRQTPDQWGAFEPDQYDHATEVEIAEIYRSSASVGCFAFATDIPADCAEFAGGSQSVPNLTTAGRHPPTYYAIVGFATRLIPDGAPKLYLMRLVSAALTSALVASAFASFARSRSPRVAALGVLVALTPMVFFIGGSVNPSGPEIAGAIGLWAAICVIAQLRPEDADDRLIARCGVAAIALALARPLGPLWIVIVAAFALALWGRARSLALARRRRVQIWAIVVALCVAAQCAWLFVAGSLDSANSNTKGIDGSRNDLVRESFGLAWTRAREMVGNFGWLDTPVPSATVVIWVVGIGVLLALALIAPRSRNVRLAGLCLLVLLVLPVALEAPKVPDAGFFWQGRYNIPIAVGIPILLGAAAGRRRDDPHDVTRVVRATAIGLAVGQLIALAQAQRRYMVGYFSEFDFWITAQWHPPVPAFLGFLAFAAAYAGLLWLLLAPRPADPRWSGEEPAREAPVGGQ